VRIFHEAEAIIALACSLASNELNLRFATRTQRLSQVHRTMDQAYQDKLDGKISEEFWKAIRFDLSKGENRGMVRPA